MHHHVAVRKFGFHQPQNINHLLKEGVFGERETEMIRAGLEGSAGPGRIKGYINAIPGADAGLQSGSNRGPFHPCRVSALCRDEKKGAPFAFWIQSDRRSYLPRYPL